MCCHTTKMKFITKATSKTFHQQRCPWGCPCSKTQVKRRLFNVLLMEKHDKVYFLWRFNVWENMMKCPWGVVSAEKQGAETCTLQCPICWSKGFAFHPPLPHGQEYSQPVVQRLLTQWELMAWMILQTVGQSRSSSDHFLHTELKLSAAL